MYINYGDILPNLDFFQILNIDVIYWIYLTYLYTQQCGRYKSLSKPSLKIAYKITFILFYNIYFSSNSLRFVSTHLSQVLSFHTLNGELDRPISPVAIITESMSVSVRHDTLNTQMDLRRHRAAEFLRLYKILNKKYCSQKGNTEKKSNHRECRLAILSKNCVIRQVMFKGLLVGYIHYICIIYFLSEIGKCGFPISDR